MEAVKCPKCQITMREREQGDVIIDICPRCRGVWLDAGELEKLSRRESRYYGDDDEDGWDERSHRSGDTPPAGREYDQSRVQSYGKRKEKKGFLQSMMENFEGEGED